MIYSRQTISPFLRTAVVIAVLIGFNLILTWNAPAHLNRPLVYYEYFAVLLLSFWIRKTSLRILMFGSLTAFDLLNLTAQFYQHDTIHFALKLPQLFRSSFEWTFWVFAALSLVSFALLLKGCAALLAWMAPEQNTHPFFPPHIRLAIGVLALLGLADLANGSVGWFPRFANMRVTQSNVAGTIVMAFFRAVSAWYLGTQPLRMLNSYASFAHQLSPSLKFFSPNHHRQMLVLVESWGAIQDPQLEIFQKHIFQELNASGYSTEFGYCPFSGNTAGAEMRELTGKEPLAYFSVLRHGSQGEFTLPAHMSKQGKVTLALFPFQPHYGRALELRKQLGFDQILSMRELRLSTHVAIEANHENQYDALNDEVAIVEAIHRLAQYPRAFAYVLTINTHLPFKLASIHKHSSSYQAFSVHWKNHFPSENAMDHYFRLQTLFKNLVHELRSGIVDEIIVVGDHAPPFLSSAERQMFSLKVVPYVALRKK